VTPLSAADRDLIADLAAVVDLYKPITTAHLRRKQSVLARARVRLAEKPKRQRWSLCKRFFLVGAA